MKLQVVMLTHPGAGTPHLEYLRRSNPGLAVEVSCAERSRGKRARKVAWRNGDRRIREWWRRSRRDAERVIFVEYDVVVNADLSQLGEEGDLTGREMPVPGGDWVFWGEVPLLPEWLRPHATGISPLACVALSGELLEAIAGAEWDGVFAEDRFCELRLATVARAAGFSVAESKLLERCTWWPRRHPGELPGVWHAVK